MSPMSTGMTTQDIEKGYITHAQKQGYPAAVWGTMLQREKDRNVEERKGGGSPLIAPLPWHGLIGPPLEEPL
jgi:hypothetical protein